MPRMTDWARVRDDGYVVPEDRSVDELVAELAGMLRSPDPTVRDRQAYAILATWIGRGVFSDHQLRALGDAMVPRFGDSEVQVRTFAPLILDAIVSAGVFEASWVPPFERWYVAEEDLRGYDAKLGWLHAVAHGADAVGELAGSPRLGRDDLVGLLGLLVRRATAPTPTYWVQNEDDRVAVAVMAVLRRDLLTADDVRAAVDALAGGWRDSEGPVSAEADNAVRLARTLHLQLVLGVRSAPGSDVVHPAVRLDALRALGAALAEVHWFYGTPT